MLASIGQLADWIGRLAKIGLDWPIGQGWSENDKFDSRMTEKESENVA